MNTQPQPRMRLRRHARPPSPTIEGRLHTILDQHPLTITFDRKERELVAFIATFSRDDAEAFHARFVIKDAADSLAYKFAGLSRARRARLLAVLSTRSEVHR